MARVQLEADSRPIQRAERDLRQLNRTGERTESVAGRITGAYRVLGGVLATLGAARAWNTILSATIEQERVTAQLEATLRSTGRYTPELSRNLQDYAASLQRVSTFGDEAIISSQALLLTFTQVGEEAFPRAQEAILDVATAMGTDLRSATQQVGRALNDPIAGLSALSRSGIQFSDVQRENIRNFVEMGDIASAQSIILGELETQFGGSARAARNTLGGAITSLKNAFGDLLEGDTQGQGVSGAVEAINELTETMNDPAVVQGFQNLVQGAIGITGAFASSIGAIQRLSSELGDTIFGGDAAFEARRNVDSITAEIERLEDELSRPRLLRLNPFRSTEDMENELRTARTELEIWTLTLEQLEQRAEDAAKSIEGMNGEVERVGGDVGQRENQQLIEITSSLEDYIFQLENGEAAYERMNFMRQAGLEEGSQEVAQIDDLIARRNQLTEAIERQETALSEFEQMQAQMEARELNQMDAIDRITRGFDERLEIIQAAYDEEQITQEQAHQAQLLALQLFEDEKARIEEEGLRESRRRQMAQLAGASQLFGELNSLANAFGDEQRGINRALFVAQKGFSIAQSIMAIQTGIAQAAAIPFPANIGAMASVASATAGIVSTIEGVQPPSFDGGGFTGRGARSGGVDGRGGFPAILHPNETVIDHTKQSSTSVRGGDVNVPIYLNVTVDEKAQSDSVEQRAEGDKRIIDVVVANVRGRKQLHRAIMDTTSAKNRTGV
ncbi:tail length tape measure protein [Idiomarinaceae phage Phi1M2-2]|uniref:tail length tape measure protein n=1 Tax=Idiomarinaceae phage Phi1M2-2 TaxID=1527515 RepID=UPI0004F6FFAD|nr:tail length tape measure protein [Idiomarinaceae phage Phi1M2-2]AIM40784.1 putative tail tape measure protein [Idiomarinaceae phage Phi1M2-2]